MIAKKIRTQITVLFWVPYHPWKFSGVIRPKVGLRIATKIFCISHKHVEREEEVSWGPRKYLPGGKPGAAPLYLHFYRHRRPLGHLNLPFWKPQRSSTHHPPSPLLFPRRVWLVSQPERQRPQPDPPPTTLHFPLLAINPHLLSPNQLPTPNRSHNKRRKQKRSP